MADKMNIVLVGGGAFNVDLLARLVKKINRTKYRIVLINPRPFFVYLPSSIRASTTAEGNLEDRATVPYDQLLTEQDEAIIGSAVSIKRDADTTGGHVVLEDGKEVPFAFLALATGTVWPSFIRWPTDRESVDRWMEEKRSKIRDATSIVIAGGGAVGIELAGEILHYYPSKRVTVVHQGEKLVNSSYPDRVRDRALERIQDIGATVILGDTVTSQDVENGIVKTSKGRELVADALFQAVGGRPATAFLKTLGDDVLTPSGRVKVKPTLQLPAYPEIFAGGDIIEWPEQKTISKVFLQGPVASANILALSKGATPTKKYGGFTEILFLSMGPRKGISYMGFLWGIVLGDWLTSVLKGMGLSVWRKTLKYR